MTHLTVVVSRTEKGRKMTDLPLSPDGSTSHDVRERAQAYFEAAAAYQSRMLEASSSYNQIVVLAGYAGFFTIWSAMSNALPRWLILFTGGLMAISLIVYVSWTVFGMILGRNQMQRMMNEIAKGPDGFLERVQGAEAKGAIDANRYMRFWKPVLWLTGIPALTGASLLAGAAFWAAAN